MFIHQLHIVDIHHTAPDTPVHQETVDICFPPEATNYFSVAMQVSKKHGIVYIVTKYSFIHQYDLKCGACMYMNQISVKTIFVTAEHDTTNEIITVNKKHQDGRVKTSWLAVHRSSTRVGYTYSEDEN